LILSPISPGAPQGQGQIQTPFGERYTGTAVWNVRNDAASPNAWGSNMNWNGFGSNAFAFALTGIEGRNLRFENSSGTYSYGCADCSVLVWESGVGTPSASTNPGILFHLSSDGQSVSATCRATECQVATPVGSRAFAASVMLSTLRESETRTFGVVQAGAAYDVRAGQGNLVCFSVFGNVKLDGTPFTPADCPGGTAVVPSRIFFGVTR
jgi:hypothetical protein